jgi:hypothetical protein
MTGSSTSQWVNVDLTGRQTLRLVVTPGDDNNFYDHANWANAQLTFGESRFSLKDNATIFVSETASVATITAVRKGNAQERMTLEYTTNEIVNSAMADVDYIRPTLNGRVNTGQIVFEVGETEKSFTVSIINDDDVEGNETFAIGIQTPSGGTLGAPRTVLISIVDDDSPTSISVTNTAITVSEGVSTANITVQRSGNLDEAVSVDFTSNDGTAATGEDYIAVNGSITFEPGQIIQTIAIPILNDIEFESSETFSLTLSNPSGASLGNATTTITILDNDNLGNLVRQIVVPSGLSQPTAIDWTPDGRYMVVAQKQGIVQVVDTETFTVQSTPLIDISSQVNGFGDRGVLGVAVHPDFPSNPYVYISYTYDPLETVGRTGAAGPDGNGNRAARVGRWTVDPSTMIADPDSLVVILGKNSTWEYTSRPDVDSTGDVSIPASGLATFDNNGNAISITGTRAPRIKDSLKTI